MIYNTLIYDNGSGLVERALADPVDGTPFWSIRGMTVVYKSMEQDTCEFSTQGGSVDDAAQFADGSTCHVYLGRAKDPTSPTGFSGGTRIFMGVVLNTPRSATGKSESVKYTLAGPWWWLANQTFEETYQVFAGYNTPGQPASGAVTTTKSTGHVFLNRESTNINWLCTGEMIQEAVQWAISHGAPIQLLGNVPTHINPTSAIGFANRTVSVSAGITTLVDIPVDEVVDITDAEVVKKQVRWTPDCVCWFDYTTTPYPTFYCKRRADLAEVSVAVKSGAFTASDVTARTDLVKQFVDIYFEEENTINGVTQLDIGEQTWPDPLGSLKNGFHGLTATIKLSGINMRVTTARVTTLPMPDANLNGPLQRAVLAKVHPWIGNPLSVSSFTILDYSRALAGSPLSYFVAPGSAQVTDWMTSPGVSSPTYTNDTMTFLVQIVGTNGDVDTQTLTCDVVATNLNTSGVPVVFELVTGFPFAEPVPPGMAEALYQALNPVQYSGSLSWVGPGGECDTGTANMGDAVSYSDLPGYASMNAQVKEVRLDVDSGRKTVTFGPANILSVGDYVELLRVTRFRLVLNDPATMNAALQTEQGGSVGDAGSLANAAAGGGFRQFAVVSDNKDGTGGNVLADSKGLFGAAGASQGPAILVQNGVGGQGDKTLLMGWSDLQDVTVVDSDGYKARFRWYQVCVVDPVTNAQTVMKAKLLGTMPQPL